MTPISQESLPDSRRYFFCSRCGESEIIRKAKKPKQKPKQKRSGCGQFGKTIVNESKEAFKAEHRNCHKKCINCYEVFIDIKD